MAATARQIFVYNFHKQRCQVLGITQAQLQHKTLQGSVSAPGPTKNVTYTPPAPGNPSVTSDTVWAVTEPMPMRSFAGNDTEIGRQAIQMLRGQCPAIDDVQASISIAEDDWLIDASGMKFRVINPVLSPDGAIWSFMLERQR